MNAFYSRKLIVHVVTKMIYINIQICVYATIYWNRNCLPFRGTLVQPLVSGAARGALSLMCCFVYLFILFSTIEFVFSRVRVPFFVCTVLYIIACPFVLFVFRKWISSSSYAFCYSTGIVTLSLTRRTDLHVNRCA